MQELLEWLKNLILKDNLLLTILGLLSSYNVIYLILGFLLKAKKYPETEEQKTYGILIPARNEEAVIGQLIESIHLQYYDHSKIKIFVVADNCTDNTAQIAREKGAIVYERFNSEKRRKGWALEFLLEQIEADYGITSLDAYMVFDADNLLDLNFVHEMNKAFVVNKHIVTGYRNTKNFDTNIISSAYGIHFYRGIVAYHRPRSRLNVGTHIAGTGYVISSTLLKDGWNWFTLTEDTELTITQSCKGYKIGFCEQAVFFDEQPTNFFVALRQRVRWDKGRLTVFFKHFPRLIFNSFRRVSFTLYDLFFYLFPWGIVSFTKLLILPIAFSIMQQNIITGSFWMDGILLPMIAMLSGLYFYDVIVATLVVIKENKNIHTTFWKKVIAIVTYPWFSLISMFIAFTALVKPNVQWKQIVHRDNRTIHDIKK